MKFNTIVLIALLCVSLVEGRGIQMRKFAHNDTISAQMVWGRSVF